MSFDYQQLTDAINIQIAPLYHTTVTPVEYVGQGDFPWYYQNQNQVFNQWTFDYLSARVSPGSAPGLARLSSSGGFPNAYASLLSIIEYSPSSTDTQQLATQAPPGSAAPSTDKTATSVCAVQDDIAFGSWALAQLIDNTRLPTNENGGMKTVDPTTGAVPPQLQVGYQVTSAIASIDNALANEDRVLSVCMPAVDGSSVQIDYPGYTLVPVASQAWQQATNIGWYDPDPIADAYRNVGRDVTGYKFTSDPPYKAGTLAEGGDLGRLAALLISGPPTTTVHHASPAAQDSAAMHTSDDNATVPEIMSALGAVGIFPSPTTNQPPGSLGASRTAGSSSGDLPVPQLQQTAYVIGACLDFPAPG